MLNFPNRTGWGAFTGVWPHPLVGQAQLLAKGHRAKGYDHRGTMALKGGFDPKGANRRSWHRFHSSSSARTPPRTFSAPLVASAKRTCTERLASMPKRGCSTQGSHVITHRSTNWACRCLTSQIGRDGVLSPEYGRIHLWGKHSCWPRVRTLACEPQLPTTRTKRCDLAGQRWRRC